MQAYKFMGYQVLARKYRPRNFDELVGQEQVTRALRHALDHNRLHHAYLFTGTRGVGKTTVARILARCLNCERGISATPCGECSTCQAITEGRFFDLIEVDAASRTGIDDTRELLDNVQYAPSMGRFKVYLIDEVHMLSMSSFNALLKTLEEPPPHVKFLLATTDPQKMPITVLSRCLQFNLKMLPVDLIAEHLAGLLQQENINFEPAALNHLGRAAAGSMRDALSLADQAIAYGDGALTEAQVRTMLGSVDRDHVQKLLRALAVGKPAGLLETVDAIFGYHPDALALLDDLISHFHQLAVQQLVPARGDGRLSELAASFPAEALQLYYDIAVRGRAALADLPDGRSGFEMLLLRMLLFRPEGVLVKAPITVENTAQGDTPQALASAASKQSGTYQTSDGGNDGVKKPDAAATTQASTAVDTSTPAAPAQQPSSQAKPATAPQKPIAADTPKAADVKSMPAATPMAGSATLGPVAAASAASPAAGLAEAPVESASAAASASEAASTSAAAVASSNAPHDQSPPWEVATPHRPVAAANKPEPAAPEFTQAPEQVVVSPVADEASAAPADKKVPAAGNKVPPIDDNKTATVAPRAAVETVPAPVKGEVAAAAAPTTPAAPVAPVSAPTQNTKPTGQHSDAMAEEPRADHLPAAMSDDDFAALSEAADLDTWWYRLLPRLAISGSTLGLAANSRLLGRADNCWRLAIVNGYRVWMSADKDQQLVAAFSEFAGEAVTLEWQLCDEVSDTPAIRAEAERLENHRQLLLSVTDDARVAALQQQFDARLIEDSIRPLKQEPHHGF